MPAEFGELGHEILNGFYAALMDGGYFTGKAAAMNIGNHTARGRQPAPSLSMKRTTR